MELKSPAFRDSQYIPAKYTCDGDNINPPFEFFNVPEATASLVLFVNDPDAPGGDWVHWVVWNIKPEIKEIKKNGVPEGATEGQNSFGKTGYGGPCPPSGTHVYIFKLYAVDIMLPADPELGKKDIKKMIDGHVLGKAVLKGFYERQFPI